MADQTVTIGGQAFTVLLDSTLNTVVQQPVTFASVTVQTALAPVATAGPNPFTALSDTPAAYTGKGGWSVRVKATENGLEFVESEGGGSVSWVDVADKPTTLEGYGITDAATSAQGAKADSAVQPAGMAAALATKMDASAFSGLTGIVVVTELPDPQVAGILYVLQPAP